MVSSYISVVTPAYSFVIGGGRARWINIFLCMLVLFFTELHSPAIIASERSEETLMSGLDSGNQQTVIDAATQLGQMESASGLEALLERQDINLLERYLLGFNNGVTKYKSNPSLLPEDIEYVLVRHFFDKKMSVMAMVWKLASRRHYSSREMFEKKLELVVSRGKNPDKKPLELLLMTKQSGIEKAMFDVIPQLHEDLQRMILLKLAIRGYPPAVEVMHVHLVDETGYAKYGMSGAYDILIRHETQQSMNVLVSHLSNFRLNGESDKEHKEVIILLGKLARAPESTPIDVDLLRKYTPYLQSSDGVLKSYLDLVKRRRLKPVTDDLYVHLDNPTWQRSVFDTLMLFDDPVIWSRSRVEIDRLSEARKIDRSSYVYMSRELNKRMEDTDKYLSDQRASKLSEQMRPEKSKYEMARRGLQRNKETLEVGQYIDEHRKLVFSMEQLAIKYAAASLVAQVYSDIVNGYIELGSYTRFTARMPEQAIQYYEAGMPFVAKSENQVGFLLNYLIADTYRFDLGNINKAMQYYRLVLDDVQAGTAVFPKPFQNSTSYIEDWLRQDMGYLTGGEVFEGELSRNNISECGAVSVFLNMMVSQSEQSLNALFSGGLIDIKDDIKITGEEAIKRINAIGRSQVFLFKVMQYIPYIGDDILLDEILNERDPAHYLSGCLLAYQLHTLSIIQQRLSEKSVALQPQQAAYKEGISTRYSKTLLVADKFKEHYKIKLQHAPDDRLASPEQTWKLFLDSLRSGDIDGVKQSFSPAMENKWQEVLPKLTDEQMAEMAEGMSNLAGGRSIGDDVKIYNVHMKNRAGEVWFTKVGDEWMIGEM